MKPSQIVQCVSISSSKSNNNISKGFSRPESYPSLLSTKIHEKKIPINGDLNDYNPNNVDPSFRWKDNPTTHKKYFDWISNQLNISHLDDWYAVKLEQVYKRGGYKLLEECYGGSLMRALRSLYPDHDWKPWVYRYRYLFISFGLATFPPKITTIMLSLYIFIYWNNSVGWGYWDIIEHHRDYFDWLVGILHLRTPTDWENVTVKDIQVFLSTKTIIDRYTNPNPNPNPNSNPTSSYRDN